MLLIEGSRKLWKLLDCFEIFWELLDCFGRLSRASEAYWSFCSVFFVNLTVFEIFSKNYFDALFSEN